MTAAAVEACAEGARVRLRVRPGSARNAIVGRTALADGREVVVVAVSAPPEGGRANRAVVELLADEWRLPRRAITVVAGAAGRTKTVLIAGDRMADLVDRIARLPAA